MGSRTVFLGVCAAAWSCGALQPARRRAVVRYASRSADEAALAELVASADVTEHVDESVLAHLRRDPKVATAALERTREMLEEARPLAHQESPLAKVEAFFVGVVRHPLMLWRTMLRTLELLEDELENKGDRKSLETAVKVKQLKMAAEAVRDARKI